MSPVLKLTTILFLSIKLVFSISYGRQNALAMFLLLQLTTVYLSTGKSHSPSANDDFATIKKDDF